MTHGRRLGRVKCYCNEDLKMNLSILHCQRHRDFRGHLYALDGKTKDFVAGKLERKVVEKRNKYLPGNGMAGM